MTMYNLCHNQTHEFGQRWYFGKLLWEQRTRNTRNEWLPWDLSAQDIAPWGMVEVGPHPTAAREVEVGDLSGKP